MHSPVHPVMDLDVTSSLPACRGPYPLLPLYGDGAVSDIHFLPEQAPSGPHMLAFHLGMQALPFARRRHHDAVPPASPEDSREMDPVMRCALPISFVS